MFNLGMGEITMILILALIFIGPAKLPELASGLGKLIREFRKTTSDVKNEIQLDDAIRKPFEELRDAVTLHPDELKRRDAIAKELEEIRKRAEEMTVTTTPEEHLPETGDVTVVSDSPLAAMMSSHSETSSATPATAPAIPSAVASAPAGTVPRGEAPVARTQTARYSSPGESRTALPGGPHVVPPVSSADATNTTQVLSEADLLPSSATTAPPPAPALPRPSGAFKLPLPSGQPPDEKKS